MIPKSLNEIEWSDLESLRDSGREEDDTIEFKGSFSGGLDFLSFSDAQRERAIKAIAREVIAFLNARGGDLIIGAEEESNESPKIRSFNILPSSSLIADRIHQTLSALIEPYQAIIGVRAIRSGEGDGGVIVVRAPRSLRAPHRFSRDKECYVRRGRESVGMPMDEIQDMTINRANARSERNTILNDRFLGLSSEMCGTQRIDTDRVHFRISYVPDVLGEVELDSDTLGIFLSGDPELIDGQNIFKNNVAYRDLNPNWHSQLRGRFVFGINECNGEFNFCKKSISTFLNLTCDLALHHEWESGSQSFKMIHYDWLLGFFANSLNGMKSLLRKFPTFSNGVIRVGVYAADGHRLIFGKSHWERVFDVPPGITFFPDYQIVSQDSFREVLVQLQIDSCGFVGIECPNPFEFA